MLVRAAAQELKLPFLTVHTWTHSVRIFGMVQILQQEVHQFFQVVIVYSILAFKYPSSNNLNLVQQRVSLALSQLRPNSESL